MPRVPSSPGRARNSPHVQRRGSSPSPTTEKSHWSGGVCGVAPAERTGKSGVTYWPGGTRSPGTSSRRRPLKAREMIGGISPPYRWEHTPAQHPVRATIGSARHWHGSAHRLLAAFVSVSVQAIRKLAASLVASCDSDTFLIPLAGAAVERTRHGSRSAASHRGGRLVDDKTELRWVGIGIIARHVEVLSSRRLEADE